MAQNGPYVSMAQIRHRYVVQFNSVSSPIAVGNNSGGHVTSGSVNTTGTGIGLNI